MIGAIIGAATGALGNILGGSARNKAIREQQKLLQQQRDENRAWYERNYYADETQRATAQAALTRAEEAYRQRNRNAAGRQAVAGGTEESVAATKEANAQALADAASTITQQGEQRKDNIEQQYRQQDSQYAANLSQLQAQRQSLFDIAAGALGGAANGLVAGGEISDLFSKKKDPVPTTST